jgi:type II secretory pathway pseudopilin PulG
MKRSVVALGLLGLVCAVALPAASAAVLYQDDFSSGKVKGVNGVYIQAIDNLTVADPAYTAISTGHFKVQTDSSMPRNYLWLDGGDSSGIAESPGNDTDGTSAIALLLTGDPKWADVAIQSRMASLDQNTGMMALVLRAAPKTKVTDPDSHYEFRYTTGNSVVLASEDRDGIVSPTGNPNLRIMKVVKGKWTMLAETDNDTQSKVYIPAVNAAGPDNDDVGAGDQTGKLTGMVLRFAAQGNVLTGYVLSKDGKKFQQILQATDKDLAAGLVGYAHYDYRPQFKDLLVQDAPADPTVP